MENEMLLSGEEHDKKASLTERQKEYLSAYRSGKTASKAASTMGVAEDTARTQLRSIARKLGFSCIKDIIANELRQSDRERASPAELMWLLKEQEFKCALTGMELTPETAQCDHILPRSKGGSDAIGNLQWVLGKVNRMKGKMNNEEFIALCGTIWRKSASGRPSPKGTGTN